MRFSTFIPFYNNKNCDTRYFAHLENGSKKELKHDHEDIYYFCVDRKRIFVKISGSLYRKHFEIIQQGVEL